MLSHSRTLCLHDPHTFFDLSLLFLPIASHAGPPAKSPTSVITASVSLLSRLTIEPVTDIKQSEPLHLPGRVALDEHRVARMAPPLPGASLKSRHSSAPK